MAITVQMRTEVSRLYVGLFGRAADGEGLGFWTNLRDQGQSLTQIANTMYATDAARGIYPSFFTNTEIVDAFYRKVLRDPPSAEHLSFWTAKLNAAGATPGSVITEMIASVVNYSGSDPDAIESKQLLNNRVAVAQYYGEKNGSVALAKYALSGVTADADTVAYALGAIDGGTVADMWTPHISSVTYDTATGRLVLTGTGFADKAGADNDVIANKLTLTGQDGSYTLTDTANVDITSPTRIVLSLSATDSAAIAALLNKDGTLSMGGITYNLSAAEDWAAGVAAALAVADLAGNGITVTQRAPSGTADFDITGNALANNLVGNRGANVIDGKEGADTMRGGEGSDTYRVDSDADVVVESAATAGGTDLVISNRGYTLGAFVENLKLVGDAFFGNGNELANVLTGNATGNFLDGKEGADTFRGGAGDDVYCVDNAGDTIIEVADVAGGRDQVLSSTSYVLGTGLEDLMLNAVTPEAPGDLSGTGNALANLLQGNDGANTLSGLGGRDTLDGGIGRDTLSGGAQADVFRFFQLPESDRILDFVSGVDRVDLSEIDADAITVNNQSFTFIGSAAFSADATGQLRLTVIPTGLMLSGSTDADANAEFTIRISGSVLVAADLLL
ncbi:calcium-binding protein [Ramlibacter sp. PS3R-8]|uniref:calcium-binding protein n=1 Tax=Ramlibacter sp. PS3R-8 TaxID=3133437 RepID=UPI00309EB669